MGLAKGWYAIFSGKAQMRMDWGISSPKTGANDDSTIGKLISEEVLTKEKADIRPSAALSPMRGC